jgi:hypothetical protein
LRHSERNRFPAQGFALVATFTLMVDAPRDDAGDYPVSIVSRHADAHADRPVCETRWIHDPSALTLGIVSMQQGSQSPRVLVLRDLRPDTP